MVFLLSHSSQRLQICPQQMQNSCKKYDKTFAAINWQSALHFLSISHIIGHSIKYLHLNHQIFLYCNWINQPTITSIVHTTSYRWRIRTYIHTRTGTVTKWELSPFQSIYKRIMSGSGTNYGLRLQLLSNNNTKWLTKRNQNLALIR